MKVLENASLFSLSLSLFMYDWNQWKMSIWMICYFFRAHFRFTDQSGENSFPHFVDEFDCIFFHIIHLWHTHKMKAEYSSCRLTFPINRLNVETCVDVQIQKRRFDWCKMCARICSMWNTEWVFCWNTRFNIEKPEYQSEYSFAFCVYRNEKFIDYTLGYSRFGRFYGRFIKATNKKMSFQLCNADKILCNRIHTHMLDWILNDLGHSRECRVVVWFLHTHLLQRCRSTARVCDERINYLDGLMLNSVWGIRKSKPNIFFFLQD